MGFSEPVKHIASKIQKKHQTLLFSATLKGNVIDLSKKLLTNPLEINVHAEAKKEENIDQRLHYVDDINHKQKILKHHLKNPEIKQAIVFIATKRQADKLTKNLLNTGYSVAALHGDMNQRQRSKTIMQLRKEKLRILIATDVAARGIDIKTISHVINFDLPTDKEDYVHRIGRTGRAGEKGVALSFATNKERSLILSIEKFTGKKIICDVIPGLGQREKATRKSYPRKRYPSNNKDNRRRQQRSFKRKNY
jgi:superfamily II DNA/RNA helicase